MPGKWHVLDDTASAAASDIAVAAPACRLPWSLTALSAEDKDMSLSEVRRVDGRASEMDMRIA